MLALLNSLSSGYFAYVLDALKKMIFQFPTIRNTHLLQTYFHVALQCLLTPKLHFPNVFTVWQRSRTTNPYGQQPLPPASLQASQSRCLYPSLEMNFACVNQKIRAKKCYYRSVKILSLFIWFYSSSIFLRVICWLLFEQTESTINKTKQHLFRTFLKAWLCNLSLSVI